MLNRVHRLKNAVLLVSGLLAGGCVLAQPLVIPPGHWQEGMSVGVAEFGGTLRVRDVHWQWQPLSVPISLPDAVQGGLINDKHSMLSESRAGKSFCVLCGHTSSLTTARPGLHPSVTFLQLTSSSSRITARGELSRGHVRYGEITFTIRHLLAWQDNATADKGWSVVSGDVTPYTGQEVKRQFWQVSHYKWTPEFSGMTARPDAFISGKASQPSSGEDRQSVAGVWVTSLSDVQVNFPGAEEPVKRWQGNLTPVVMYF